MAYGFATFGASFPQRYMTPTSQQVGYLPTYDEWLSDFESRWADRAASGGGSDPAPKTIQQVSPDGPQTFTSSGGPSVFKEGSNLNPVDVTGGRQPVYGDTGDWRQDRLNFRNTPFTERQYTTPQPEAQAMSTGPDFSDLIAERERMQPRFESQKALQQAYDAMMGFNQRNAIPGPGYGRPGFGQVDGNLENPFGVPNQSGVDLSFTDGVLDPTMENPQQTGVYSPKNPRQFAWGL